MTEDQINEIRGPGGMTLEEKRERLKKFLERQKELTEKFEKEHGPLPQPQQPSSQPNALSFEKWFKENSPPPCRGRDYTAKNTVQAAWNHQQAIIDQLQRENAELRAIIKNAALERGLT